MIEKQLKNYLNYIQTKFNMTLPEAVRIVKRHQEWRQGAEIEMSEPKIITQAIDTLLKQIEERYTKQEFLDTAEFCEVSMIDEVRESIVK